MLTSTYPWGPGEEFITPELPHWVRDNVHLTIMPWRTTDLLRPVPDGITVDDRLDRIRRRSWRGALARAPFTPLMWREAAASIRAGVAAPHALWRIAVPAAAASLTSRALRSFAREHGRIDLAYSYWFDYATLGALRSRHVVDAVASRAHRHDNFDYASPDGRLPFRRHMAPRLDLLAPISDVGLAYARERFGVPESRSHTYRLGVPATDDISPVPPADGPVRLLSVSSLTPVKRVDRLIETLEVLATGGLDIEWSHAGSGPLAEELRRQAEALPRNVRVTWLGQLGHDQLTAVLAEPWNLIVNVSSSEGVPVSLMEAMGRGIPVAATAVGGTAELIVPPDGVLLPPNAMTSEWAAKIRSAIPRTRDPEWRAGFRNDVRERWNEDSNQAAFVSAMVALASRSADD